MNLHRITDYLSFTLLITFLTVSLSLFTILSLLMGSVVTLTVILLLTLTLLMLLSLLLSLGLSVFTTVNMSMSLYFTVILIAIMISSNAVIIISDDSYNEMMIVRKRQRIAEYVTGICLWKSVLFAFCLPNCPSLLHLFLCPTHNFKKSTLHPDSTFICFYSIQISRLKKPQTIRCLILAEISPLFES